MDRRFGENDPTLSLEERMLERFTKERQRASKGMAFNMEDEDDLTHYGQSLSKMDDFDDVGLEEDSDEEDRHGKYEAYSALPNINTGAGQIARDVVSRTHFGGFGDEPEEEEEGVRLLRNLVNLFLTQYL